MESLEALVAHIQGLSGSPEEVAHLHSLLKQADGDSLRSHAAALVPFLTHLSPEAHSLGYLYLLEACATSGANLGADFLVTVADFLTACSADQIRLAPDKFLNVCRVFKDQVMLLNTPIRGIAPLRAAVRKIQASPEQLTPVHAEYLLLCLLAKQYKAGLSVLEDDIFEVDQPKDLFLYCYYGGMIYIGLKKFPKASELLHNAVTAPMSSLNAIAVEAYKKYILVSLIQNGQVPSFPKYTSATAQRNMKNHAQIYVELSTCYGNGRYTDLETFVESNAAVFQSDNNLGLAKQVLSSMYKRNIQRLTQTYLTLSLEDIARSVQLDTPRDAEMHVLRMIEDGEIHATINQKDGMVSFHEDPEQYKSVEMVEHIDTSIQRLTALSKKLASIDENMACDPAYLLKVDVKDTGDSWEQHFDKISVEERSKFDEETLYNLEGIKKKKSYSRKPDGFRNEYIVLTILVAADGALKFPQVRNYADLEAVVEKLNSIPARQIQGIQVLWTPQEENDIVSEEKLLEDYPYLKALCDD
ncbi:COP9 signalosome complex subunit 3 isoform X3 [Setaria italica]|uniref:COP9 signalosome complex subunit 3 isoform X3 n=1 Tax=Setaria italica TaxID=4555 RepID=UPI000BE577A6|nr:COP9 signalosome complex subunit 3 isoform X3 [Setaria italica]